ncbi:MAG: hypothetical protein HY716_08730 [Planctomycetes bacterium]|nr:hypothetical protein [Planctomycetota bacterium]
MGLPGVTKVEMDLERDLFRVSRGGENAASEDRIFAAIRELSYTPSRADPSTFQARPEFHRPVGQPPEIMWSAVEKARRESKRFIIVECTGDN